MFLYKQLLHTYIIISDVVIICKTLLFVTPTHILRGHVKLSFICISRAQKKKKQSLTIATSFFFPNRLSESLSENVPS